MNNLALKYTKEIGHVSVKIQDLLDNAKFPEESFENPKRQKFYENCLYYHKKQKGLIRVSKYGFNYSADEKRKCLKKRGIQIETSNTNFLYNDESTDDTKIWYMNFADKYAFTEWGSYSTSLEAVQTVQMPLLHKTCSYLKSYAKERPEISLMDNRTVYRDEEGFYNPIPILFEGVPVWLKIDAEKAEPIQAEKRTNIISMLSSFGGKGIYKEGHILYLLYTLFAGFGGIEKLGIRDKKFSSVLYTGNWGCGIMKNNKELIYLSQLCVADFTGINKIVFHKCDESALKNAVEKYHLLIDEMSFVEFAAFLVNQNYEWN